MWRESHRTLSQWLVLCMGEPATEKLVAAIKPRHAYYHVADALQRHPVTVYKWVTGRLKCSLWDMYHTLWAAQETGCLRELEIAVDPQDIIRMVISFPFDLFRKYGLSIPFSDDSREELMHIGRENRVEALADAARLIDSLAPIGEKRRKRLRQANHLMQFDERILGLNTYIDHDTDHAVWLILQWLEQNDPVRWQDLHENLEHIIDISYRQKDILTIPAHRTLNNLLSYTVLFGPSASAEKAVHRALQLWDMEPTAASAYVLRDTLHCAVLRGRAFAEQRFYDFLRSAFRPTTKAEGETARLAIPGLEILYFAPSVWSYQNQILNSQLLPDQTHLAEADLSQALKQVLNHINRPDLPALSQANYALVCVKLIQANRRSLFRSLNPEMVDAMSRLSSVPTPAAFQGDRLLRDIWGKMIGLFSIVEAGWHSSQAEFQRVTGQKEV